MGITQTASRAQWFRTCNSEFEDRDFRSYCFAYREIVPTGAPLLAHLLDDVSGQACRGRVDARWAHSQRRDLRLEDHMGLLMGLETHCLYTSLFKPVTHTSLQEASIGRTMTTNGGYSEAPTLAPVGLWGWIPSSRPIVAFASDSYYC